MKSTLMSQGKRALAYVVSVWNLVRSEFTLQVEKYQAKMI